MKERVLGDQAAHLTFDPFGAVGNLVCALTLTPLLGAVGVADGHADDRNGRVDTGDGPHARDAPSRAYDHGSIEFGAQDRVRRSDVAAAFGGNRCGLESQATVFHRDRRLVDDRVVGLTALLEREVVVNEVEFETDDARREDAERFHEEFLAGLIAVQDDDGGFRHGRYL